MTNNVRAAAHPLRQLAACALLVALSAACGGGGDANNAPQANAGASSNNSAAAGNTTAGGEVKNYDAEIERLEKEATKNPGNSETLALLARAYVRRGNAFRDAGRMREAMDDYRRAQRNDPDNEEAQRNAADIAPQVEGTPPTGEYGEPAPLPISPNVADDDKPTPTPKKREP